MELSTETELTQEQRAELKIHELAAAIENNYQLRKVVGNAVIGLRKAVYEQIVPHLSFKPLPYKKLMQR